jgi:hypothetical protein
MRRLLLAILLTGGLWVARAPTIEASEQWCSGDPVEIILTENGALIPVYVTNSAEGLDHLANVLAAEISYTTTATASGTLVKMTVVVPTGLLGSSFPTASVVTLGPVGTGPVLAQTTGTSGQPMPLNFTLPPP